MGRNRIIGALAIILVIIAAYTTLSKNNTAANNGQKSPQGNPPAVSQTTGPKDPNPGSDTGKINFTVKDLDGKDVSISDFKGKKVFVNFWATWCPYCVEELPHIQKLYNETKDSDLVILVVDVGEDKKTVEDFIKKNNYSFKVLMDKDGSVAAQFNINSLPRSFFIDSYGKLSNVVPGAMSYEQMKEQIDLLE